MKEYIDFQVAPYALPKVCEALWRNGIKDGCITMEDGKIHIRWEWDVNRFICRSDDKCKDACSNG